MAALQLDLSGPHRKTLSGNSYIATFICLYSGWIECFSLPDKSAQSVLECLLEQMLPRHGCPLSITTDNGLEFVNEYFKDTLEKLNIRHIKTSTYSPRGNGAVERSHRTLNDMLSKLMGEHNDTWDLYINTALAALRTNVSKTTAMTPFKLLYNRDPVLPLDNLLRPRVSTHSEQYHEMAFENLHKSFMTVLKNSKKAKVSRNKIRNKNRKPKDFKIGDPVYLKNHRKSTKLDKNWVTHHTIVEKLGPLSFKVRHQLTGKVSRVHADSLRLADTEWVIPKVSNDRPIRRARLAASPPSSSSDLSESDSEMDSDTSSDATVIYDPSNWKERAIRREKKLMENSDSDDIPEFDLKKNSRVQREGDRTGESDSEPEVSMETAQVEINKENKCPDKKKRQLQLLVDAVANFF